MNKIRIAGAVLILLLISAGAWARGEVATEDDDGEVAVSSSDQRYNEAPMLAAMVAAGELPPVDERLPDVPMVQPTVTEIGEYGGTLHTAMFDINPWGDLSGDDQYMGGGLGSYSPDMRLIGGVAEAVDLSADQKTVTLHLREGMKWSDGVRFTADDFIFHWDALQFTPGVVTWNSLTFDSWNKIDDYTVEFSSSGSAVGDYRNMGLWKGSDWMMYHPKHYLERFHPDYDDNAEALADELGFENWAAALSYHTSWAPRNEDAEGGWAPTTYPWIYESRDTTQKLFVRNPYYYRVDAEGNQLPYVDRLVTSIVADAEVYNARILSGESDVAYMTTTFADFTLFKQNEAAGDYKVTALQGFNAADAAIAFNQFIEDPVKRELYRDDRFRQAMSLAINRDDVNEVLFAGQASPTQFTIGPTVSWYKQEWGNAWAEYDPDLANQMLDELGLSERNSEGTRLLSNGEPLEVLLFATTEWAWHTTAASVFELVKEYWEGVGVKAIMNSIDPGAVDFREYEIDTRDATYGACIMATEFAATEQLHFLRRLCDLGAVRGWFLWWYYYAFGEGGGSQIVGADTSPMTEDNPQWYLLEEPPEHYKEMARGHDNLVNMITGSPEYIELATELYDWHAEHIPIIGVVGLLPQLYIASNGVGNTPTALLPWMTWNGELNYFADQLFWKDASRR